MYVIAVIIELGKSKLRDWFPIFPAVLCRTIQMNRLPQPGLSNQWLYH